MNGPIATNGYGYELERSAKHPESAHAIWLRRIVCGIDGCHELAPRWRRCARCRRLVARCPTHEHRFADQVAEHCA